MLQLDALLKTKKAFLWDFDGCFCDSEYVHFLAYAKAFGDFGHTVREDQYYHTFTHTGAGAAEEIEKYHLTCSVDAIRERKIKYYGELIAAGHARIFPEIPAILRALKKRGIRSVIASNSPAEEIKIILEQSSEKLELEQVFGMEKGLRKKPFPDLFLKAMRELGVPAQECMVVEDSERGLMAAHAAHCDALWVNTPLTANFTSRAPYLAKLTHQEILTLTRTL